jgi:peroxiredoxin
MRITFVVNRLRVIDAVFSHEVSIDKHRDDVLRTIDTMYRARPASWLPSGPSKLPR